MRFTKLVTSISFAVGSVLFVSNSAQAASFTSNVSQNTDPTADIFLNSITQKNKDGVDETFSKFSFVNEVKIKENDEWTGGNTGAASTDKGIDASSPYQVNEDPTTDEVAAFLGNNNLNNIIDTEDKGHFEVQVFFEDILRADNSGLDSLFFYERGKNSNLLIQALDAKGNTAGNKLLLRGRDRKAQKTIEQTYDSEVKQQDSGFKIDTMEIGFNKDGSRKNKAQGVGSWGVSLADLGVENLSGVQIYANGRSYNGPDFKVIGRQSYTRDFAQAAKVPEPGTIIGLGSVAALAFMRRRKSK